MSQQSEATGKYGIIRLSFLKSHRQGLYSQLLTNGELTNHLSDVNVRATTAVQEVLFELLKTNPPPDKTRFPDKWAQHMNTVKHQAEEIVCREFIYI